jgi:hypothetical protein
VRRLGLHRVCWPAVLLRCAVPHNDHRPLKRRRLRCWWLYQLPRLLRRCLRLDSR